jgi:hypothetical protein
MSPSVDFSTVNEGQWLFSHGFQPGMGGPGDLSIGWYDNGGGDAGHTAATLPGGINAESGGGHGFQLGGAVGAGSSMFTNHAYLPMGGAGGSGGLGAPSGAQHDPVYVMSADTDAGGAGGGDPGAQTLGQGLLSGLAQSVGLDGSVFKTFNGKGSPLDFGATKMISGLANFGMGMLPHGGAAALHGDTPGGDTHIHNYGDVLHQPMTVNQTVPQGESVLAMQHANNGRATGLTVAHNLPGN